MRSLLLLLASAGALAAENRDAAFSQSIAQMFPKLVEIRRDIHSHPELPNEEVRTAKLVADRLKELGFTDIKTGVAGTGVVAILKGAQDGPCVAVRADMDALPIVEATGLPYASKKPGQMHACGHDGHTAMLLGAARYLANNPDFDGTAVFIFQPAEESEGGAAKTAQRRSVGGRTHNRRQP